MTLLSDFSCEILTFFKTPIEMTHHTGLKTPAHLDESEYRMKLQGYDQAVIEVAKIRDYLLSPAHPVGRFKAAFFAAFGYNEDNWQQLETDLRLLVESEEARECRSSRHGPKYEVRGFLKGPNGKSVEVVTVWIIRKGENVPSFITAYPGERP
jgi:hypothetical protein